MLSFVPLLLFIGFLSAPSFFNSKIKHQTANFSPDLLSPELYYIFISTIFVSINWIGYLIYKSRYMWRDMKESLFKISIFLSSPPHRSGTFKSLKYLFTEEKASDSNKNNARSKKSPHFHVDFAHSFSQPNQNGLFIKILFWRAQLHPHLLLSTQMLGRWR